MLDDQIAPTISTSPSKMQLPQIHCSGTPYEIGVQHGSATKEQVARSITFYSNFFMKSTGQSWDQVLETARGFEDDIKKNWPDYWDEMLGIAHSSTQPIHSILALNIRTEIAFGQCLTDGCTACSWRTSSHSFLGQNWDWNPAQQENLIALTITPAAGSGKPVIKMVTEAGILGKIGMNDRGVGVCLNAIRVPGVAVGMGRVPVHLGLRRVLECASAKEAVEYLRRTGVAASGHMLIADGETGGYGVEFSSKTVEVLEMDAEGRVCHTNHLIKKHERVIEPPYLDDSPVRLKRVTKLADELKEKMNRRGDTDRGPSMEEFSKLFDDHEDGPGSICRHCKPPVTESATLFTIVMDLTGKKAVVRLGRPCEVLDEVFFAF